MWNVNEQQMCRPPQTSVFIRLADVHSRNLKYSSQITRKQKRNKGKLFVEMLKYHVLHFGTRAALCRWFLTVQLDTGGCGCNKKTELQEPAPTVTNIQTKPKLTESEASGTVNTTGGSGSKTVRNKQPGEFVSCVCVPLSSLKKLSAVEMSVFPFVSIW